MNTLSSITGLGKMPTNKMVFVKRDDNGVITKILQEIEGITKILYIKPISYNQAYKCKNNKIYMSKEAKEFKNNISKELDSYIKIEGKVKIVIEFY